MYYFDKEHQHVRSYFMDLASGASFHPDDLTEELRIDTHELSSADVAKVRSITKQADRDIKALKADGHLQKAREKAETVAYQVAELVGERLVSNRKRKLPSDPRELAAMIRRPGQGGSR